MKYSLAQDLCQVTMTGQVLLYSPVPAFTREGAMVTHFAIGYCPHPRCAHYIIVWAARDLAELVTDHAAHGTRVFLHGRFVVEEFMDERGMRRQMVVIAAEDLRILPNPAGPDSRYDFDPDDIDAALMIRPTLWVADALGLPATTFEHGDLQPLAPRLN